MKRVLCFLFLLFSCSLMAKDFEIERGKPFQKEIRLKFNDYAVENKEFVEFKINKSFDLEQFDVTLNGKPLTEHTFKVYADKNDVVAHLIITPRGNTSGGNHKFSISVNGTSEKLNDGISFKGEEKLSIAMSLPRSKSEQIKRLAIGGGVLLLLLILGWVYYRSSRKFKKGTIDFQLPFSDYIKLKGRPVYIISDSDKKCVARLTKGQKGFPIITKVMTDPIDVNGVVVTRKRQLKKNDVVTIRRSGEVIVQFTYY